MRLTFQTAAVGPGGVEILVVIVLLKFLKRKIWKILVVRKMYGTVKVSVEEH